MKTHVDFSLALLSIMLITLTASAADASSKTSKTVIPKIASIGGVQIGCSTQEELAQRWGEGLVCIDGHPNSGRRWRVRDTDWLIATDGFLYSSRGLVIDEFEVKTQSGQESVTKVPFAKLDKKAFGWLGEISPGMTKPEVFVALKRHALKYKSQAGKVAVEARGYSAITSELNGDFHSWQAVLVFEDNKLSRLQLGSSH